MKQWWWRWGNPEQTPVAYPKTVEVEKEAELMKDRSVKNNGRS